MPNKSDAQLLREYAADGREPAFGEIVARHTDLVYSAALRQSGAPEAAREIAQSVFIDLARKARTLAKELDEHASLAGWLYRGTRYAVLNSLRDERRRQARDKIVMEQFNPAPAAEDDWACVAPVLDEAMSELGDADREAVLLRYFQNQDFQAVGRALGVSEDAAQKRVSRAVDRLRDLLTERGVAVGATGLVLLISANSIQAAPSGIAATFASVSLTGAGTATGSTITFLKFMVWTKAKATAAIGLGVLLTAGTATVVIVSNQEPSFQGRRLSEWLKDLDPANKNEQRKNEAKSAIRQMGSTAVPFIVKELRCTDSTATLFVRTLAQKQTLVQFRPTTALQRRTRAYIAFNQVTPVATSAVPALAEALQGNDADLRLRAANCLDNVAFYKIDATRAVPALTSALRDPDERVGRDSAHALGRIGVPARSAVPALRERILSDERLMVRAASAEALGSIGPATDEIIVTLIQALTDKSEGVRSCAARGLGKFGEDARKAVPELLRIAKEDNEYMRQRARDELKKIDPDSARLLGEK